MVFVVKYRKSLIEKEKMEFLKEILIEIGERYWFKFDAIGMEKDHFWTDGGHIDTVSEYGGLEKTRRYVEEQGGNLTQLQLSAFQ